RHSSIFGGRTFRGCENDGPDQTALAECPEPLSTRHTPLVVAALTAPGHRAARPDLDTGSGRRREGPQSRPVRHAVGDPEPQRRTAGGAAHIGHGMSRATAQAYGCRFVCRADAPPLRADRPAPSDCRGPHTRGQRPRRTAARATGKAPGRFRYADDATVASGVCQVAGSRGRQTAGGSAYTLAGSGSALVGRTGPNLQ